MVETELHRRAPAYPSEPRSLPTVIIRTDDPQYFPSSSAQVQKVVEIVSKISDDITAMRASSGRDAVGGSRDIIGSASEARFADLAKQWRSGVVRDSTVLDMATHPAYQQVIGMGRTAVPFILRELARSPDHWFWALKAITGEDPVPEEERGDLRRMAQAWLIWGARNGYDF